MEGEAEAVYEVLQQKSEEAYQKLSILLNWRFKNRVSIIVYNSHNDFQQTNVVKQYMQEEGQPLDVAIVAEDSPVSGLL